MGLIESLRTINSLITTVVAVAVLSLLSTAGWYGYRAVQGTKSDLAQAEEKLQQVSTELARKTRQVDQLADELEASRRRIDQLETAMHLLKVDHRLAEIRVIDQGQDPETEQAYSQIEFLEINEEGNAIGKPKRFRVAGNKVYVDYLVVKFDDKYVENSDLNRSTSICLFRGIHGELQKPAEAYRLDTIGTRPAAYSRGRPMSDFEQQIWTDFWDIANDPQRARDKGIRAAHGEAAYMEVRPGKVYRLELRASGGLTIRPWERAE